MNGRTQEGNAGPLLKQESFGMTLTLADRVAGEMTFAVAPEKHAWVARVQTDFSGVLPDLRRVQTSRLHPRFLTSLGYAEGDGRRASFETVIDRRAGLVTVKQGRDEASAPFVTELHDPVSILLWLRQALPPERMDVMMVGGRVHVLRLPDADVHGVTCVVYELRPGGALVYIEAEGARRLLRLVQPTDFGPIDAVLAQKADRDRPRGRAEPGRRRRRGN